MKAVQYLIAFLIIACNHVASDDEAIRMVINNLIAADNRGDLEAVLSHYAPSATLMPPGKANISGMEKLRENYQNIFSATRLELTSTIEGVEVNQFSALAWGYNIGKAVSLKDSSVRVINDKYLMHLIKEKGEWKVQRLIWNSK